MIEENTTANTTTINPEQQKPQDDNNNISTMSTQLSTDQLICKTPQESPTNSIKSSPKKFNHQNHNNYLIYTGCLQFLSGILMVFFGVLAVIYKSSLAQAGGGIWGGGLAITTGIFGVVAAAKSWCPLKATPQKLAHTVFLALSLISLAISQLVVALASMGLLRDYYNLVHDSVEEAISTTQSPEFGTIYIALPMNYPCLLCNIGLIIVSSIECIVAAIASYKSSRVLCPCFRTQQIPDEMMYRNAFVHSWLGKHNPPPQLYLVAAPSTLGGKDSKIDLPPLAPIFALPPPPPMPISYPLIPAPLGTIPSPIIPPPSRRELLRYHKKYISKLKGEGRPVQKSISNTSLNSKKSRTMEKQESEEDITKTYTGLDKAIAEEFIDICDSKNTSLCSDSSCTSSCNRSCNMTNSDVSSRDYLVNK